VAAHPSAFTRSACPHQESSALSVTPLSHGNVSWNRCELTSRHTCSKQCSKSNKMAKHRQRRLLRRRHKRLAAHTTSIEKAASVLLIVLSLGRDTGFSASSVKFPKPQFSENHGTPLVRKADYTSISNNVWGVEAFFERRTARTPRSCFDSALVEERIIDDEGSHVIFRAELGPTQPSLRSHVRP
jgi:hypothetical protein